MSQTTFRYNSRAGLVMDRDSLHESEGYRRQVDALKQLRNRRAPMADHMTLEQVRDELRYCAKGSYQVPALVLADAIDAAIKQREQDKRDAARWRAFKELATAWHKEPLVNAKTGEGIAGIVRWTIWIHEAKDCATVWDAIDAAMAKESGQ